MLERIRKLLAKAEATEFAEEAATLTGGSVRGGWDPLGRVHGREAADRARLDGGSWSADQIPRLASRSWAIRSSGPSKVRPRVWSRP